MHKFLFAACVCAVSLLTEAAPFADGDVVVFFGDSITHGGRYHAYLADYYNTRFPEARIRFVNSGIGGDTAAGAYKRIPEDVAEYKPTYVTFHFGMNDINRGAYLAESTSGSLASRERAQADYRASLGKLIEGVRKAVPDAKFVYLTPTPYDDTAVVTNAPKSGWASVNQVGCNLGLSLMAGHVIEAAARDKVACVDWFSPLNNFMLRHQKENRYFSFVRNDRVHPEELGHSVMAWAFLKAQGAPSVVSEVEIDVASGKAVRAENAAVGELKTASDAVSFT
ncbi:MAG: SGNH/GDSL hydrolase family protein, partial [bacterium]|nr:SGNH/GDSL hydrolase family protein [Candidatus Colisoma equi]